MTPVGWVLVGLLQVMAPTLPGAGTPEAITPEIIPSVFRDGSFQRSPGHPVRVRGWDLARPGSGSDYPGPLGLAGRSLLLPGWGQKVADRGHWWVYAGAEAVAWGGGIHQRREGARFRQAYRDLAWSVARVPVWDGPRRDGAWGYYERMAVWRASGIFDLSPDGATFQPETDETTYNGMVWRLARELHLPPGVGPGDPGDPAFERALAYYRERAVPPELRWDWGEAPEARERFRGLIGRSDEAFRNATTFVGMALVNRFISGVEMWVAAHPGPAASLPVQVRSRVFPGAAPGRWELRFHLEGREVAPPLSAPHMLAPSTSGGRPP
jgi:hypothetical protein